MSRISIENLNLYYGQKHALRDVNLEIRDRAVTALIGPSGCGKSSLLRCVNRMNDLVGKVRIEGRLFLDGEDVYDRRVDLTLLRRKVGMVFQQPTPFPMSIYDNVAYGPRLQGIRNRRRLDGIVEAALAQAAVLEEVKDKLQARRAAAETVHCQSPGRGAGGAFDGRTHFCPGSGVHPEGGGAGEGAEAPLYRGHCDP